MVVPCTADNVLEQESPEFGGRERIQAARGFIEKQHRRPVKHGARQAQPVNVPRRKRAHLAVEQLAEAERAGEFRNPPRGLGIGNIIEAGKQHQIFSRAEARIKASVPAGVIANLQADLGGLTGDIETADLGAAASGNQ